LLQRKALLTEGETSELASTQHARRQVSNIDAWEL
jgi:hypothetical protein